MFDVLASEYGWTHEYILSLKVPILFRYIYCIRQRYAPEEKTEPITAPDIIRMPTIERRLP